MARREEEAEVRAIFCRERGKVGKSVAMEARRREPSLIL